MALDMKWNGLRWTDLAISLLTLAAIFYFVEPARLAAILMKADWRWVLAGALAYSLTMLSMSWRLSFILRYLGGRVSLMRSWLANSAGLLASDLTPARSGYFVVPFLFERHDGVPLEKGMAAVISPQIADFFLKAVVAAAGIFLILALQPSLENNALLLFGGAAAMMGFAIALAMLLFVPQTLGLVKPFLSIPLAQKFHDFVRLMQAQRGKVVPIFHIILALSILNLLFKGIEWYCLGQALGVQFSASADPLVLFMMLQALISALQFVPIPTVAGLGLAEGGAAASMMMLGVPAELSVAFLLLTRAVTTIMDCAGLGELAAILRKRK